MSVTPGAITETDVDEFVRTYSRPDGFRGAGGLYRSMLREGADIVALAASHPLTVPALAVGAGGGDFTTATLSHALPGEVRSVNLEGIGHYPAMEAPNALATALLDFFRSVDYLATRPDVDQDRLAYYAVSMGAYFAPIPIALEPRIKAAVLIAGGLRYNFPDEVQPANFMPRVHVPTLLLNGRDDFGSSLQAEERYLELLGTPDKKHLVLDGGHVPGDWRAVIRETLDWYDKYLGPIK